MKNIIVGFFVLNLFFHTAFAFQPLGAVSGSTAGTGRGTIEGVDGVWLNPALISILPQKNLTLGGSSEHLQALFVDNGKEALFAAALMYNQVKNDVQKSKDYKLGIGINILHDLSFGLDVGFEEIELTSLNEKYRPITSNIGFFYTAGPEFSVGIVSHKTQLNDLTAPEGIKNRSTLGIGFSTVFENFIKFKVDVESEERQTIKKLIYMYGLESFMNDWIVLRLGYRNDNVHSLNYLTAGVGFTGPQFGLHYAYQNEANSITDPLHTVDLNIPF